ncbi:hypothetical protein HMPREF1870_00788 [Bacteroidales bacterium KA00344]|nr:hypothetical protein HMPREF1870_00788 [Bacteroidales bacterium KA00344]
MAKKREKFGHISAVYTFFPKFFKNFGSKMPSFSFLRLHIKSVR